MGPGVEDGLRGGGGGGEGRGGRGKGGGGGGRREGGEGGARGASKSELTLLALGGERSRHVDGGGEVDVSWRRRGADGADALLLALARAEDGHEGSAEASPTRNLLRRQAGRGRGRVARGEDEGVGGRRRRESRVSGKGGKGSRVGVGLGRGRRGDSGVNGANEVPSTRRGANWKGGVGGRAR